MARPFNHEDILPDAALEDVRFPRQPTGNAPQSLAIMLLAEFGLEPRAWFPSAAIVTLLTEFGTTTAGARAVVNRLARRGVLEGSRNGRRTSYRLTDPASIALRRGGHALVTFAHQAEDWDGFWTLVAFSIPQGEDSERSTLRARLRWRGFRPLYDALWISPQASVAVLDAALAHTTQCDLSVFRAHQVELHRTTTRDPLSLWDTAAIAQEYEEFLIRWNPALARVRSGAITGAEAVRIRNEIEDDYRRFVVLDPRLPLHRMPQGWLRAQARDVFAAVYDHLAGPALDHVRRVIAHHDPDHGLDIRAHTTSELASGVLLPLTQACPDGHCPG